MNIRQKVVASVGAVALVLTSGLMVSAEPQAPVTADIVITGGTLTFGITAYDFDNKNFSFSAQQSNGSLSGFLNDSRGTYAGWEAEIVVTPLTHSSPYATGPLVPELRNNINDIDISQVGQTLTSPPTIDGGTTGPWTISLDAEAGEGSGSYAATIPLKVTVPGNSPAGSYTSTATFTVDTVGP